LGLTILFVLISFLNTITYKEQIINIDTDKINKDIRIAQISDIHLFGKTSESRFNKIYTQIIALNPDVIVITGDLFDKPGVIPENAINIINDYNIPVYFSFGNHELIYGKENSINILNNTNAIVLDNKSSYNNDSGINFIGITYSYEPNNLEKTIQTIDINKDNYNILLYHEPIGVIDAQKKDVDLMLSGHTHAGQVFPLAPLIKLIYKYTDGLYYIGGNKEMVLYVSPGTGVWGPKLRNLSRNEITIFDLKKI